jgi:hypothetical protein
VCFEDVGGGVADDLDEFALSNITLRWMVREVIQAQCGIVFDSTALGRAHIPLTVSNIFKPTKGKGGKKQATLHDFGLRREWGVGSDSGSNASIERVEQGPEIERDAREVEQPIYDALKKAKLWWLLELIPTKYTWQKTSTNQWVSEWWYVPRCAWTWP